MSDRQQECISLVCTFYDQMKIFVTELSDTYPEDVYFSSFRIMLQTDAIPKQKLMDKFVEFVLPFESRIMQKNESFFLDECASSFSSVEPSRRHQLSGSAGLRFANIWRTMDAEQRETMWEWFSLFVLLSKKFISMKDV